MPVIQQLRAGEILDSRGRPTVKTYCQLQSGAVAAASVPSGASTGAAEALELRDGDLKRHRGLGCRRAVANVNGEINAALAGREFPNQKELDAALLKLDGTENKSRLGANAVLSVSLAFARATAAAHGRSLHTQFAKIPGQPLRHIPRPAINLFSGGKHAGCQVEIQDVLVVPASARTMDEALAMTCEIYQCAAELTARKYGVRALRADEGGLAPPAPDAAALLADAVAAIERAGLKPGRDVCLAVDVAASHFYRDGHYELDGKKMPAAEMIAVLTAWMADYPIVSIEDGLAENDWSNWPALLDAVSGRALVMGDDLLCTNPERIRRAAAESCADALLLKVNQIGTLTEAAQAMRLARDAGWQVMISARSGETEDDWLADLAVGWSADQIKIGSITQSERLSKYNRLLELEAETGLKLNSWPSGWGLMSERFYK
jgi:enolase